MNAAGAAGRVIVMKKMKAIGSAKRITVDLGFERRRAWDCRPFGYGRIVTAILPVQIELEPGTHLDLRSGVILAALTSAAA
jgi:hypothetical protein